DDEDAKAAADALETRGNVRGHFGTGRRLEPCVSLRPCGNQKLFPRKPALEEICRIARLRGDLGRSGEQEEQGQTEKNPRSVRGRNARDGCPTRGRSCRPGPFGPGCCGESKGPALRDTVIGLT